MISKDTRGTQPPEGAESLQVKKSLKYSMGDGIFFSLMNGFTADYFTPFLLLIGGTVRHVSIIAALPNLASSLIQPKSADISEKTDSRKKVVDLCSLFQALTLVPMLAVYFMGSGRIAVFIAVVTLFTSFGALANPAWASIMADLVSTDKRGEYFGWRNKVLGFVTVGATFAAGYILYELDRFNIFIGFAVVFALAFAFRLASWRYLTRMHEPELIHKKDDYFSLYDFVSRFRHSNFARFVFFAAAMKFAVNVAAPFLPVLMLRDLKFSYLTYTAVTVAATIATNVTIMRWGIHADRIGNMKVIKFSSKLVAFVPLLWLINTHPVFLFFVQLFAGFAWAGFNLSASNFIYDASTPGKRTRCIAYFNAFTGVALCLGALLGGWLAEIMPDGFFTHKILGIVLLSAILRLAVAYLLPFNLSEVREVEDMRSHELLISMIKAKPASGKKPPLIR
ncbi:MAG: MFS transporter [Deltaproteobacteria bacterium]|nr:MFS transporter [Deltaproteobacteria bacterium]